MDIRAHGANYGLGMYLCGNAETTVNGNVTMNTHDEKNPWAVYVEDDGGFSYYAALPSMPEIITHSRWDRS